MLLTEKVFQSIFGICILEYSDDTSERREHPRVEFGRRATIIPLINGERSQAQIVVIRDMSIKGCGVLQSERRKPHDQFILDVSKFVGRPLGIRCAVERCEPGGSGGTQFVVGATFEALIETPEELVPAPEPVELVAEQRPKRTPVFARLRSRLQLPNWGWLAFARRGSDITKRLHTR